MSLTLHGLKQCDTCRKAMKWLEANNIAYQFNDIRTNTPSESDIAMWLSEVGDKVLVNRRSTTWRGLDDRAKATAEGDNAGTLLSSNPTLIKRPVVTGRKQTLVGFDPERWAAALLA